MGENLKSDLEVIKAIRVVHPHCSFVLDANEKFTSEEAIIVLEKLHGKDRSIFSTACSFGAENSALDAIYFTW